MPPVLRRVVAALLLAALLVLPASAGAQTSTIPEEGADVSTTPPVPLPGERSRRPASASELPNTGADARVLFLAGLAMTLIGFGLRLRTADADDY